MEEHKNPTTENREHLWTVEYVSRFAFSFYKLSGHIAMNIYQVTLELSIQTYANDNVNCSLFLLDFNRK